MTGKTIINTLRLVAMLLVRGEKNIFIKEGKVVTPKISREARGMMYSKIIIDDPVERPQKRDRLEKFKKSVEEGKVSFTQEVNNQLVEDLRNYAKRSPGIATNGDLKKYWFVNNEDGEIPEVRVDRALPGGEWVIFIGGHRIKVRTIE